MSDTIYNPTYRYNPNYYKNDSETQYEEYPSKRQRVGAYTSASDGLDHYINASALDNDKKDMARITVLSKMQCVVCLMEKAPYRFIASYKEDIDGGIVDVVRRISDRDLYQIGCGHRSTDEKFKKVTLEMDSLEGKIPGFIIWNLKQKMYALFETTGQDQFERDVNALNGS